MANAQTMTEPAAQSMQVAAGSAEVGSSIVPVNEALHETRPHTASEVGRPNQGDSSVNAGLGAQSIDGGTILASEEQSKLEGKKKKKKKGGKCLVQ